MKFLLYISMFLLAACIHTRTEHSKALHQFTVQYEKALRNHCCFKKMGYGGTLMHDIEEVDLAYGIEVAQNDMATARAIAVGCIDLFIKMINVDEKVHPYLHERPFPPKQYTLTLFFMKFDGSQYESEGVTSMLCCGGSLYYHQYDPITHSLNDLHKETYEEAKRLVEQQKQQTEARNQKEPAIRYYSLTKPTAFFNLHSNHEILISYFAFVADFMHDA